MTRVMKLHGKRNHLYGLAKLKKMAIRMVSKMLKFMMMVYSDGFNKEKPELLDDDLYTNGYKDGKADQTE